MPQSERRQRKFRLAAPPAVLLAAASLGGCGSTYGTGQHPEAAIFNEMTGGIVGTVTRKNQKPEIDYSARAPLVEPPAQQLNAPVQTASISHPDWPVDPDKTASEEVSDEITPEYRERLEPLKVLSRTRPVSGDRGFRDSGMESPQEFHTDRNARKKFAASTTESKGVGVGPGQRKYLTQPPEDYGMPAETAPAEFDKIEKKKKGWFFGLFGGA